MQKGLESFRQALNPDWAKARNLKEEEDYLIREYGFQIFSCGLYGESYASFCRRIRQIEKERSLLNMEEKVYTEEDVKDFLKLRTTVGTPSK